MLTLMVTSTRIYRNTAHGLYITTMAVADIIFLLTQPLNRSYVHDMFGWDIRAYSVVGCKIYYFLLRWARPMSSMVIVLVAFERFVAVWFPLKAKIFSSRRIAIIEVAGILSVASIVSAFRTQMVGIQNNVCLDVVLTPHNRRVNAICSLMGITIQTLIPTIMLLLMTPPTVAKLFYQRHLRLQMSNGQASHSDETFRVSMMLLSVAVAFCVLVTPFCLSYHAYLLTGTYIGAPSTPSMIILNEVRLHCEQINCVINFVLYALISRVFRRQFYQILTCQREKIHGSPRLFRSSDKGTVKTVTSTAASD